MKNAVLGAFDGDTFLYDEVERVIRDYEIDAVVETGTRTGQTTEAFAKMVKKVYTIEISQSMWPATAHFDHAGSNIIRFLKDSAAVFKNLEFLYPEEKVLFYLDAHGHQHSPLLDEIEGIAKAGLRPVIVIHDFCNPNHPEYGYDYSWDIGPYTLNTISSSLEMVYGRNYCYWYNNEAAGIQHGAIFIAPLDDPPRLP